MGHELTLGGGTGSLIVGRRKAWGCPSFLGPRPSGLGGKIRLHNSIWAMQASGGTRMWVRASERIESIHGAREVPRLVTV